MAKKISIRFTSLFFLVTLFLVSCGNDNNSETTQLVQNDSKAASPTTVENRLKPLRKNMNANDELNSPPSSLTKVKRFVPPAQPTVTVNLESPSKNIKSDPGISSNEPAVGQSSDQELLRLTNEHRAKVGCPSVKLNSQLSAAANGHAKDMATNRYVDHKSPSGEDPTKRAVRAGYGKTPVIGENIAAGQPNAQKAFKAWLDSKDGHRENIEWCIYEELGVGSAKSNAGAWYWVYVLGRRS